MYNPLKAFKKEFQLIGAENDIINAMPEDTKPQRARKQLAREAARLRRQGKPYDESLLQPNWRPGDDPVAGIPPGAASQGLYLALTKKGTSSDDAKMYVLNQHIGDETEWNDALLASLKD